MRMGLRRHFNFTIILAAFVFLTAAGFEWVDRRLLGQAKGSGSQKDKRRQDDREIEMSSKTHAHLNS